MDDDLDGLEALKQVLAMAEEFRWRVTLFGVVESLGPSARMLVTCVPPDDLKARVLHNRVAQLEALIAMIRHDSCQLRARAAFGNPVKEIMREVAADRYDMLIKRCENNSSDNRLTRNCKLPVWLLKPEDFSKSGEIIMANAPRFAAEKRI